MTSSFHADQIFPVTHVKAAANVQEYLGLGEYTSSSNGSTTAAFLDLTLVLSLSFCLCPLNRVSRLFNAVAVSLDLNPAWKTGSQKCVKAQLSNVSSKSQISDFPLIQNIQRLFDICKTFASLALTFIWALCAR